MVSIYISPIYFALCAWMAILACKWLRIIGAVFRKKTFTVGYCIVVALLSLMPLFATYCPYRQLKRILQQFSNYWLGFCLYALLTTLMACIVCLVWFFVHRKSHVKVRERKVMRMVGAICALILTTTCVCGIINARIIRTTEYDVKIDKDAGDLKDLKIVLAADFHMGYNLGCSQLEKTVDAINAQNPDIVLIGGDIFDNQYEALEDPDRLAEIFRGIQSKYGVYAVYGNHDVEEKLLAGFALETDKSKKATGPSAEMRAFCERAGFRMLEDEAVLIDDSFYLYGRKDAGSNGDAIRKTPAECLESMDHSKPIIVLDHQPSQLQEKAAAGADLDLNGHTHNGQLFPGTITINFFWDNAYGYMKVGNMHDIVTSGVGAYGPYMRMACRAEICTINVEFQK